MSVYSFQVKDVNGQDVSLATYKDEVMLIVNVASKCGFTPQYEELQQLYEAYKEQGLVVLGFPCNQFGGQEPGTNEEVQAFCQTEYGVTFPVFAKVEVKGAQKHPLFAYLIEHQPFAGFDTSTPRGKRMQDMFAERSPEELNDDEIKWNFTKFLISRDGEVIGRYESPVSPSQLKPIIEDALQRS